MTQTISPAFASLSKLDRPGLPLNSASQELAQQGYMEQEYTLHGTAGRYRFPDFGRDAEPVDGGHAYETRVLVRRPADMSRISGTVVVEWLNVSCGQDLDFIYAATRELLYRSGHVWVGLSVQGAGVDRLRSGRPSRYASLSVAAPTEDPATGLPLDLPHPLTGIPGNDVLGWDIFSGMGRLLCSGASQTLGLPPAKRVIAAGESQSAIRLSHYFNSIQPLHRVYHGYLLYDRAGLMPLRTDVDAKVISIGTDFFAELFGGSPREDADNQRWWELAGSSHVSFSEMHDYIDPQVLRDGLQLLDGRPASLTEVLDGAHAGPKGRLWSRVPNGDLVKAALDSLERWISGALIPARSPRLMLDRSNRLLRDGNGRTLGGIRYAAHEIPAGLNEGIGPEGATLAGGHADFDAKEMTRRYGNAASYLQQVEAVLDANLTQGFLLPQEADRVRMEASLVHFQT